MIEYIFKSYANIDIFFEMEQKKIKKKSAKAKNFLPFSSALGVKRWYGVFNKYPNVHRNTL